MFSFLVMVGCLTVAYLTFCTCVVDSKYSVLSLICLSLFALSTRLFLYLNFDTFLKLEHKYPALSPS